MNTCYKIFVWIAFICLPALGFCQSYSLIDIVTGPTGSTPQKLTRGNDTLYFTADNGTDGRELWKSGGTLASTVQISDVNGNTSSSDPDELTFINGILYFSAKNFFGVRQLFQYDPATGVTTVFAGLFTAQFLTNVNGTLFFSASNTLETELYKATGPGTSALVRNINGANNGNPSGLTNINGVLYFSADSTTAVTGIGTEFWKSDGTDIGTVLVKDINPGAASSNPTKITNVGGLAYFIADDGTNGTEVWKSDGTTTVLLVNINTTAGVGSLPTELTNVNGTLYFSADPGSGFPFLWKSDGTVGTATQITGTYLTPTNLTNVNGTLFFSAFEFTNSIELFKTDPSVSSATFVKDINPGGASSSPLNLVGFGSTLLFSADDGSAVPPHGRELWKSQGTSATTTLVQDIESGSSSSNPANITFVGTKSFLTATTAAAGTELYVDLTSFAALPLTSLEFKGRLVLNNGLLEWKTANEVNTSEFIIERSVDGRSYTAVGNVVANGNTSSVSSYQFTDHNITSLGASVVYYRLLQKDINGRSTYSRILAIPVNSKNVMATLYPNPVRNEANLMISLAQDEKLSLRIIDNTGHIVKQNTQSLSAGSTSIGINVEGLAKGVYFINIQGESLQKLIRFVKN